MTGLFVERQSMLPTCTSPIFSPCPFTVFMKNHILEFVRGIICLSLIISCDSPNDQTQFGDQTRGRFLLVKGHVVCDPR